MKKTFFILLLFSAFTYAQKKPITNKHVAKIETKDLTIEQYDFLKSIQNKYSVFPIPKQIENIYLDGQLLQSQYMFEEKSGSLMVVLQPDNKSLSYELDAINVGLFKGQYLYLGDTIVKTELIEDKEYNVYFDGKKEL
jgi:hypothetical protein